MKLSPDSPELTAYALDELAPADRAALEAALADAPELRDELAALRATADALSAEFATEPAVELSSAQRAAIVRTAEPAPTISRPRRPEPTPWARFLAWRNALVWATAAVGVAALALLLSRPARPVELAFNDLRYQPGRPAVAAVTNGEAKVVVLEQATSTADRLETAMPIGGVAGEKSAQVLALNPNQSAAAKMSVVNPPAVSSVTDPSLGLPAPAADAQSLMWSEPRLAARYSLATAAGRAKTATAPQGGIAEVPVAFGESEKLGEVRLLRERTDKLTSRYEGKAPGALLNGEASGQGGLPQLATSDSMGRLDASARYLYKAAAANSETYAPVVDNPFKDVTAAPLSTFGMDVDTGSYSNIRRFLRDGALPPADAVRLEELINYFHYDYPAPQGDDPFRATVEVAACPWNEAHKLVRIGVKAREIPRGERPRANLVFLLDVSGSMEPEARLPLVKRAMRLLLDRLTPRDTVGIVTYAGEAKVALEPVALGPDGKQRVTDVLESLRAGSGTHGSAGIQNAYAMATNHFVKDGVNRVILCTDGDFNIGITDQTELLNLITREAKSGVFLSVLGFGMDNLKDATMETLADKGNGAYAYIDSFSEARKVLVEQLDGTLVTVAKDAKVQVEFNPARVASYRLLGYEKRLLRDRDFNDDTKDAGEVGAGHTVTVLYEIVPATPNLAGVDPLRYGERKSVLGGNLEALKPVHTDELLNLKLRYKQPDGDKSRLIEQPVKDSDRELGQAGGDFKFAAAVAGYGMLLRDSPHKGDLTWEKVLRLAEQGQGDDPAGYRAEFIDLVRKAQKLAGRQ